MYTLAAAPKISVLSTQYIRVSVSATDQGLSVDPTSSSVSFAFLASGEIPEDDDWKSGDWETANNEYLARCLVGPDGSATLVAGTYKVWLKIVLAPETIIESVGDLYIY